MNWATLKAALHQWVVACTQLSAQKVVWGRQKETPRPEHDGIIMKLYVVDDDGGSWVDTVDNPLVFADLVVTSVSGNNLTIANHNLVTGDGPVNLIGAALPSPILANTNYWVIRVNANTIQLAVQFEDTGGGDATGNPITPITLSTSGTPPITLVCTSKSLRSGQEILHVQQGLVRMTLQLYSYVADDTGANGAIAILRRVGNRHKLPTNKQILKDVGLNVTSFDRARAMLGTQDAILFEPRAWVDISLSLGYAESEFGTIIGRTEITQETPTPGWVSTIENEDL